MRSFKGIALLIVTNLLIFLTLVISGNILIHFVLPMFGIDVRGSVATHQFAWAMVFGFGGAFISLLMSKTMVKRSMNMQQVVVPQTEKEALVFNTVKELAEREGINMPEVWVYWDDAPNAFATGPTRNSAMVAVSSGLAMNLSDDELRAVLAHEVGHIANGDMLATTLLQGLMNTFVYFLASMIARAVATVAPGDDEEGGMNFMIYFVVDMVLQILFSILASIVVCWFSRQREFRADAYAADALGADGMIRALRKIEYLSQQTAPVEEGQQDALATLKIYGANGGFVGLFATHPSIDDRVAALQQRNHR